MIFNFLFLIILATQALAQVQLYGLNYGARRSRDSCPSYEQIQQDLSIIGKFTSKIKIFSLTDSQIFGSDDGGSCKVAELVLTAASMVKPDMNIYLGLWINGNEAQYQREKAELQRLLTVMPHIVDKQVEAVVVGSEPMYRNETSADEQLAKVKEIRAILSSHPSIKITLADVMGDYFTDSLLRSLDFVMPSSYIYWQGYKNEEALQRQQESIARLTAKARGTPFVIGEMGWPSEGNAFGEAVPSLENTQKFFEAWVCHAKSNNIPYFWFSAFDEEWKPNNHNVETSFGLFKADRSPKIDLAFTC